MKQYLTFSEKETKDLAKKLAKKIKSGVIALIGELGAGKTTFAAGFAKGLGIKEKIISPTFVLIRQHKIPNTKRTLYHVDLYRLETVNIKGLGLKEIFLDPDAVILIEWADKLEKLPKGSIKIIISRQNTNKRKFLILNS